MKLTGPQRWLVWLLSFAASFGVLEFEAIENTAPNTPTLSESWWHLVGLKGAPRIKQRWLRIALRVTLGAFLIWLFFHLDFHVFAQEGVTVTPVVEIPGRLLAPDRGIDTVVIDLVQTPHRCIFVVRPSLPNGAPSIQVLGKVGDGCL